MYLRFGKNGGNQGSLAKNGILRIRAVRVFRSTEPTYIVNYNANGATGGTVPSDSYHYEPGQSVSVLDNTGTLVKTDYIFDGWNTLANGDGTDQAVGSTFAMGGDNVTLYAKWTGNYTVTFDKNDSGAEGTMVDQTIASGPSENLTACAFTKTGWTFAGWATTPGETAIYADGASYTMGTSDVILYAQWTAPTTYSIRDIGPAGGLIFYDKGSISDGWRYLEAAPSDQCDSDSQTFSNITDVEIGASAQGKAIGTGQANTTAIIAQPGHTTSAAQLCEDYSVTVDSVIYNEWFLPSIYELNLMYANLHDQTPSVGGFASDDWYWSSSEATTLPSSSHVWIQIFSDGRMAENCKYYTLYVRAVRAF